MDNEGLLDVIMNETIVVIGTTDYRGVLFV